MNKRLEVHLVSLGITIKEVFIRTKLQGKLTFQIRADNQLSSIRNRLYKLENQHCAVYQHVILPLQLQFDAITQTYKPLQMTILVNLDDEQGNAVGGYVRCNPFQQRNKEKEWKLPLEILFPNSTLHFSSKIELLSKKQSGISKQYFNNDTSLISKKSKPNQEFRKSSIINYLTPNQPKNYVKEAYQTNSDKYIPKQKVFAKTKRAQESKIIINDKKMVKDIGKVSSPRNRQDNKSSKFNDQMQNLRKKIEEQRVEKVRSISKLKMQLNPRLLTGELCQADQEKSKLKERIRFLQRKQKNYQINIDDLHKQIENLKAKVQQTLKSKDEYQRSLGEKQIKLKAANQNIKALNEQIDSLMSKEKVVSKKGEVKENMLKNEAKRMQEKIRNAEEEANNAIKQKNQLIKNMAQLQKKHQAALREKDAKLNEQKTKFNKQKQQWSSTNKQLEFMIKGLQEKIASQQKELKNKLQSISELEIGMIKQQNDTAQLKQSLKEYRQLQDRVHKQNQYNQQTQYINLKKLKNELDSQKNILEEKHKRQINDKQVVELRAKELQKILKEKSSQNQKHVMRINTLQKAFESQKQDNNRKAKEIEHLKLTVANLNAKISELRQKANQQKNKREETSNDFEKHLLYFNKQKEALQIQIKDLNWTIVRENDKNEKLQNKIKQLDNQILKLNEQLMSKTQRIMTLEQKSKILQVQNQNLAKQKNSSSLKIKEQIEINKMKHYQADQQKKNRLKAEQKYEEEKAKSNQLQIIAKTREAQQQKRQKQREVQIKELLKKNQSLENEIFKKNQQLMALKNTNELINRQIHITKTQFQALENQLTIFRSENSQLKQEVAILTSKNQELAQQIATSSQKLTIQTKRTKIMKQQHEQYKASIRLSFENLTKEFFKDQINSSTFATTLIPFPDQSLSSLQIQLVQQRNNFIVKQRQKIADLEMQVGRLERQVSELKVFYQNREGDFKNDEIKERQKLKTLVYQTMVQKNNVVDELNMRTIQKQELFREYQKLRTQIIRREDNESELNGQLQMLLLQYEGLKAENQDLHNLIYKYREQEIKNQGEMEHKLLIINQQNTKSIQLLRSENNQKERKIIDLQRQKLEMSQKEKRKDIEKNKYKDQYQKSVEKLKQQDHTIIKLSAESTKLNNTIKDHEIREIRFKQTIQNNENRIAQYKQKIQSLQNEINDLQQEIHTEMVANQKLKGNNYNLTERLQETNKLLYEKGQISKQKIEKKIQQNAQLKTKIIQKESELSLRNFSLKQKEQQNSQLSQENNELKLIVENLKNKTKQISQQKDNCQMRIRQTKKQYEELQHQKRKVEEMLAKSNFNVYNLETYLNNLNQVEQQLKEKEKECIQLRMAKAESQQVYEHELKKHIQSLAQCKKELQNQKNQHRFIHEEHKESLQYLEKNNTAKYNELLFQFQKQREEFEKRVEEIEIHNTKVVAQLERRLDKANEMLEQARYTLKILNEQISKKDNGLSQLKKRLQSLQNTNQDLKQKYNKYYLQYQECKAQKEQMLRQNGEKIISSINQTKNTMQKSFKSKLADINRQMHKLKYTEEINLQNEPMTKKEIFSTLQRIFSKVENYLEDRENSEGSDSFQVKKLSMNVSM